MSRPTYKDFKCTCDMGFVGHTCAYCQRRANEPEPLEILLDEEVQKIRKQTAEDIVEYLQNELLPMVLTSSLGLTIVNIAIADIQEEYLEGK